MTADDLLSRLNGHPFRPFRVRLTNNTAIDVTEPGMVIVGPSSAVLPTEFARSEYGEKMALRWKTIALNHIVEFNNLD
jgi:hypothetical protein